MPVITAIETQRGDEERANVYLDGRFGFGASKMVVLARNLHQGQEISEEEVTALLQDDAVERAWGAALHFLSFRPRSRREIEDYFRRKKTDTNIVEAVVERLLRSGLLDDQEFARFWVENRQTFRPRGSRALRVEMRQKGLAGEVIDHALEGISEEATAYEAGERKLRAFSALDDREFARKMTAFLQRRGFPYEVSAQTARKLLAERGGEDDATTSLDEEIEGSPGL